MNHRISILVLAMMTLSSGAEALDDPLTAWGAIHDRPQLLAPGFINTGLATRDLAMTSDGNEIYFCTNTSGYTHAFILVTRFNDGAWTEPEVVSFSGHPDFIDLEPALSPDDQSLFFYSTRPVFEGQEGAQDIWVVRRQSDGWSDPQNLGAPINTEDPEYFPSVTADGTLYFCRADPATRRHDIYCSRLAGGKYGEPVKLPPVVNSGASQFNAWVSPDESRLIVPVVGHPDNLGGVDYWLCLREKNDEWSGPFNLGPEVNDGAGQSWSPSLSPNQEFFFFMSGRTVGDPMSWPVSWSEMQHRHRHPGCGRSGIFVMRADFLKNLPDPLPRSDGNSSAPGEGPNLADFLPFPEMDGLYWGQSPPASQPEIFAPGRVSTGLIERDIVFSSDGCLLMYGVMDLGVVTVMFSEFQNGHWGEPVSAPWHRDKEFACFEPALSFDGNTVYFLSNKAAPGQIQGRGWANQNIFASRREGGTWSEAEALPPPITTEAAEYYPSLADDGTLFFSREDQQGHPAIWAAPRRTGGFGEPFRLPAEVNVGQDNYNAFIAPDQEFIIFCVGGHEDNLGPADYWISFRGPGGFWLPARNLGPEFNGEGTRAMSAFVSPDKQVLFFSSNRMAKNNRSKGDRLTRQDLLTMHNEPGMGSSDLWWVEASVLEDLR